MTKIPLEGHPILYLISIAQNSQKSSETRHKLSHPEDAKAARQVNVLGYPGRDPGTGKKQHSI